MFKLLIILFIMKLYAQNDIFKRIKKKHGQDVITVIRSLEKLQTKYGKVVADIKYIKTCKKERLIPTFAKVNISLKNATHKLRQKISLLVMNTELENKHSENRKLKKEIKKICIELKRNFSLIILNTILHQIRVAVKSRLKNISKRHENKLFNLHKQQQFNQRNNEKGNNYIKSTVHNFSSYQLSDDELTALSCGLDRHIPNKLNRNRIHTEFEQFYQNSIKDISHIPDDNLTHLKTKLRSTCERYRKIHISYKIKRSYNFFIFQKTEKNRILNIHSICNYSDNLF